jgi:hypothetical protein
MTKNGDFGQNRSTSKGCRIMGTQNAFRFFFCLKHSVTIAEQKKLHIEGFLWPLSFKKKSQGMLVPEACKS